MGFGGVQDGVVEVSPIATGQLLSEEWGLGWLHFHPGISASVLAGNDGTGREGKGTDLRLAPAHCWSVLYSGHSVLTTALLGHLHCPSCFLSSASLYLQMLHEPDHGQGWVPPILSSCTWEPRMLRHSCLA